MDSMDRFFTEPYMGIEESFLERENIIKKFGFPNKLGRTAGMKLEILYYDPIEIVYEDGSFSYLGLYIKKMSRSNLNMLVSLKDLEYIHDLTFYSIINILAKKNVTSYEVKVPIDYNEDEEGRIIITTNCTIHFSPSPQQRLIKILYSKQLGTFNTVRQIF